NDDNNNKLSNSNKTIRSTTITTDRQYDIYDIVNENFDRALNENIPIYKCNTKLVTFLLRKSSSFILIT
ncbi:MAG: hypothetical protein M3250_07325, partial [Thermoproteota archaeon]|nr:hypothetical protein [Thermoproteota archaeon]